MLQIVCVVAYYMVRSELLCRHTTSECLHTIIGVTTGNGGNHTDSNSTILTSINLLWSGIVWIQQEQCQRHCLPVNTGGECCCWCWRHHLW